MIRFSFHVSALLTTVLLAASAAPACSQYRGQEPRRPSASETVKPSSSGFPGGLFDPTRFSMSHSVSMGYASFGGQDLGYSMYTNSLMYKISDPLTLRADVSLMYSPFGSLAKNSRADFSGIFLQRADLEYRPSKDFGIHLQFRQLPPSTVNPFTRGYGYPYGFNGLWTDD